MSLRSNPAPKFPQKYSTRVEVNQLEDDKSYEMQAFYDYSKKKATLDLRENSKFSSKLVLFIQIFFSAEPTFDVPLVPPPDNQPLYETTCKTFPLKESTSLNYYFGYSGITYLNPKDANTFFRFDSYSRSYEGEDFVRGILCDVYVSCQYNEATKANYTIRHYFSKPSITFPGNNDTYPRIIMRAKYTGVALKQDGSLKPFNNTFDYHEFRLDFDRDDVFQELYLISRFS
ncbi:hypothetical protein BpHYR1_049384 [Brachionus plicatilis]|uniref:LolA-like domain-containing protein n=1 Tax=Brachionus plicatilis TaxID=10195 RepID=A0A3M7RE88_BRAPC|nr:hypothetical protein BpHYR1_049384 [Brachionus plicatilis]